MSLGVQVGQVRYDKYVPPLGSPDAKYVIVGEAPGEVEARTGKPFVGPAGSLLQDSLQQNRIIKSEVYLTNVVKEKPYKNNIKPFFNGKEFTKAGVQYVLNLREELAQTSANVILAMGNTALAALCDKTSITKWRGSILESTLLPGRKVIPVLHPSSALRQYINRYFISRDIERAVYESQFPEIRRPKRNYIINPTIHQTIAWLDAHAHLKEVSIDIENTAQLEISCIAFSYSPEEAICVPVPNYSPEHEAIFWRRVGKIFSDPTMTIIGQNVAYDCTFLSKRYNLLPLARIDDTMIAQNIMFPEFPKGLDFLNSFYTDEPYYKEDRKEWKAVKDWPRFWRYNAKDAATTLEIWNILKFMLKDMGLEEVYRKTVDLHPVLFAMMSYGVRTDQEAIQENIKKAEQQIVELQQQIDKIVRDKGFVNKMAKPGAYINVNSPTQMKTYFYKFLGIPPYKSKGKETCDDKALQRLAKGTATRPGLLEASLIQELRGVKKFLGTYLEIEYDEDKRFRCTYNPRGTVSGRLSSEKTIFHTGMNQQNIPLEFKGFMKADSGYVMCTMDKRQAEWVIAAYVSQEPNMIKIVESGMDIHAATATMLTGIPLELIKPEDNWIGHTTNPVEIAQKRKEFIQKHHYEDIYAAAVFIPTSLSCRQCGKKSNHAFNYGMGYAKFAVDNTVPDREAKRIYDDYHRIYPGLKEWHKSVQRTLRNGRTLENCFGRKITFLDKFDDHLFKKGYNFYPQSTVADTINDCMLEGYKSQRATLRKIIWLIQNHDEIVFQYPLEDVSQLAITILQLKRMLEPKLVYHGREFVVQTDLKVGLDWFNMTDVNMHSGFTTLKNDLELTTANWR